MTEKFDHLFIEPGDFERTLRFYRDVLGWMALEDGGAPRFASLRSPGGTVLVIAEDLEDRGDHAKIKGHNGSRPTIHFRVDDVDVLYEALPKGTHIAFPPEDTHWGTRWFVASDPDGNLIAFESQIGKPR